MSAPTGAGRPDGGSTTAGGMSAGATGVIHDIGYRHYDGPRNGRPAITRALALDSLRGAYGLGRSARSKVLPFVLLGIACLVGGILALVTVLTGAAELPIGYAQLSNSLRTLVIIFLAVAAPQLVSKDLRFRTVSLYFSRPLTRQDYVLAKYLAMTGAVFALMALPQTVMLVGALLAKLDALDQLTAWLQGVAGSVVGALVLGGIALLISSLTPRRGLGVAAVVGVLFILNTAVGAGTVIADQLGRPSLSTWISLVDPSSAWYQFQVFVLGAPDSGIGASVDAATGSVAILVCVAWVALTALGLLARYRKVSVS